MQKSYFETCLSSSELYLELSDDTLIEKKISVSFQENRVLLLRKLITTSDFWQI